MKVEWTDKHDAFLMDLLVEGKSYKQAAAALSYAFKQEFTKNSCIGRARRLKVPPRKPETEIKDDVIIPAIAVLKRRRRPITIYQLRDDRCKWPIGKQPPYLFCGKFTGMVGCSWCEEHRKKVFGRSAA